MARTRAELELILDTTLRDVERFTMPDDSWSVGTVNSKRWVTINEELEDLAVMLIDELHESEQDSLTQVTEAIWADIRKHLLSWAEIIQTTRETYYREHVEPALLEKIENIEDGAMRVVSRA